MYEVQELFQWIESLDKDGAGLLIGFISISSTILIFLGIGFFRKYHAVNKVPTSRVGAAQSGYVELIGRPESFEKIRLKSPLTNQSCIWYAYKVERYMRIRKRHDSEAKWQWHTVYYDTSHQYLLLRDHTGFCVIDTDDHPLFRLKRIYKGRGKDAPKSNTQPELLTGLKLLYWSSVPFVPKYRYTEEVIGEDDALYALGQFDCLDASELPYEPEMKEKLLAYKERQAKATNEAVDEAGKALRRLDFGSVIDSAVKMHMAQQDPEMLDQFDQNDDGMLDGGDLNNIEKRLDRAVLGEYRNKNGLQQLNIMRNPNIWKQPFILSTIPQGMLIRSYQLRSFICLGVAGVLLSLALAVLLIRLL